jgi:predicted 3-demethylubiquinone-9 3-methyltransferase (glyoxalase superfamily)
MTEKSPKITPFLWFDGDALDAAELYVKVHPRSRVLDVSRRGSAVSSVTFELDGQRVIALNGGPVYALTPAFSFYVNCADQAEVDRLWSALLEGGGKPVKCGWLVDRFGVSWQIIPEALPRLMGDPDPEKAGRVVKAMMAMEKLDVAGLERAHAGT